MRRIMTSLVLALAASGSAAVAGEFAHPVPPDAPVIASYAFRINYSVATSERNRPVRIEFFMTQDMGKTWTKYGEDPDLQSPMTVRVNNDGVYGFVSVATDSRGNREREPVSGTRPESVVVVDRQLPTARWIKPAAGNLVLSDEVEFEWVAEDQNFGPGPVTIEASFDGRQTWTPIGVDLPPAGTYSWRPSGQAGLIHFRLVARDRAGNTLQLGCPATLTVDNTPPTVEILRPRKTGSLDVNVEYVAQDDFGGTGLMDVTLYASYDNGASWRIAAVSPAPGAAIPFKAEQSGRIGLSAVARDRAYNHSPLPAIGVVPFWLEIDTEGPNVRLDTFPSNQDWVRAGLSETIRWFSDDKNPNPYGASVFLSRDGGSTWRKEIDNQNATGSTHIVFPSEDIPEFRVKVEVVDEFGNKGSAESRVFRVERQKAIITDVGPLQGGRGAPSPAVIPTPANNTGLDLDNTSLIPIGPNPTGRPTTPDDDSTAIVFPSQTINKVLKNTDTPQAPAAAGERNWSDILGSPDTGSAAPAAPAPSSLLEPGPATPPTIPNMPSSIAPDSGGLGGLPPMPQPGAPATSPAPAIPTPPSPGLTEMPALPTLTPAAPGTSGGQSPAGGMPPMPTPGTSTPPASGSLTELFGTSGGVDNRRLETLQAMAIDPTRAGDAVQQLQALMREHPGNFDVQAALATAYHTNKDYVNAGIVAENAAGLNPQNWFAHLLLGNIYCSHAEVLNKQAAQAAGGNLDAQTLGDQRDRMIDRAKRELLLARELNPNDKHVYLRLGDVVSLEGQVEQARSQATYLRSVEGVPNDNDRKTAKVYASEAAAPRYKEAAQYYLAAYQIPPVGYHEAFALGRIYFLLSDFDEARKYLQIAIQHASSIDGMQVQIGEAYHTLGLTYALLGQYATDENQATPYYRQALEYLERARQEYPANHPALPGLDRAIAGARLELNR